MSDRVDNLEGEGMLRIFWRPAMDMADDHRSISDETLFVDAGKAIAMEWDNLPFHKKLLLITFPSSRGC